MDISFNNWNKSFKAFLIITILLPNTSLLKFSSKKQKDYHWTEAEAKKKTMLTISKDQSINKNSSTNSIYVQILKQTLFSFIYFSISNFFWEQKRKKKQMLKRRHNFLQQIHKFYMTQTNTPKKISVKLKKFILLLFLMIMFPILTSTQLFMFYLCFS